MVQPTISQNMDAMDWYLVFTNRKRCGTTTWFTVTLGYLIVIRLFEHDSSSSELWYTMYTWWSGGCSSRSRCQDTSNWENVAIRWIDIKPRVTLGCLCLIAACSNNKTIAAEHQIWHHQPILFQTKSVQDYCRGLVRLQFFDDLAFTFPRCSNFALPFRDRFFSSSCNSICFMVLVSTI
jgi:hypothetical protein